MWVQLKPTRLVHLETGSEIGWDGKSIVLRTGEAAQRTLYFTVEEEKAKAFIDALASGLRAFSMMDFNT